MAKTTLPPDSRRAQDPRATVTPLRPAPAPRPPLTLADVASITLNRDDGDAYQTWTPQEIAYALSLAAHTTKDSVALTDYNCVNLHLRGIAALLLTIQGGEGSWDDFERHDNAALSFLGAALNFLAGVLESAPPPMEPTPGGSRGYRVNLTSAPAEAAP